MEARVRGIPQPLWREFKAMCALQGKSMNEALVELITKAVEDWKKGRSKKN